MKILGTNVSANCSWVYIMMLGYLASQNGENTRIVNLDGNKKRFATLTHEQMEKILTDKDSMNTKRVTNSSVKVFRNYLKEKGLREDFENCTNDELDGMLTQFYAEARTQNGEKYQKSSLNAIRYGINRHVGKDIINDVVFKKSREMYVAVTKELKREGKGGINHYPPIEDDDLVKMYAYFDTNDSVKLQQKVFVDVMLYFGRRGRENLALLNITDFAATTDANGDLYVYITKDEQTKNHQDDPNSADGRMYAKKDDDMCPVKSFLKYKKHLNPKCSRFFQRPGKSDMTWYDNCPVGHNRISNMMVTISERAGLSKKYTNHSLRATSVHILDSKQFAGRHIMSVTGHKSETSLKTYTGYTDQKIKRKMSETISESLHPSKMSKLDEPTENINPNSEAFDAEFDEIMKTIETIPCL